MLLSFLSAFVLLVGCVCGIVIPAPRVQPKGKYFAGANLLDVTLNDPRCKGNGIYPNPTDCTRYYSCKDGNSQDRKCPGGFKFDSDEHCTLDSKADCGEKAIRQLSVVLNGVVCPEEDLNFIYPGDCHKYIRCHDGKPEIKVCPMHQIYKTNTGCVDGDVCPQQQQQSEEACEIADGIFPTSSGDCHKYIKCVNGQPILKECPQGQGFDRKRKVCADLRKVRCRSNEMSEIMGY